MTKILNIQNYFETI